MGWALLLNPRNWAIAATIAIAAYTGWLKWDNTKLEESNLGLRADVVTAVGVADDNFTALEIERTRSKLMAKTLSDLHGKQALTFDHLSRAREAVANSSPDDDGQVALVLSDVFARMYEGEPNEK